MEIENKAGAVNQNDVVLVESAAPLGWKKRFTPRKSSTPRRNDVVFVSPDGDEIKNKRQLDKYLKSHPGGPPASEFDWGTGDTPRRSSRLGEKSKATETPESETRSKRQRISSSKKGAEDGGEQEAEGATEKETKGSAEPAVPDAEGLEVQDVEIASKKVLTGGDNLKDEEKTSDGEIFPEEPPASEYKMEIVQEKEKLGEGNLEKLENQEAEDKPLDNSLKTDNKPLPLNMVKENKIESKPTGTDASSHSAELSEATSASQEERAEEAPTAADALNVLEENKAESILAGEDASSHSAELSKATSISQEETADALVQNSNDAKVDKNEQIDREIPIEEINGTEAAVAGVNISVENNSVQQESTVVDQVTSS